MGRRRSSEEKLIAELFKAAFQGVALIFHLTVMVLSAPFHLFGIASNRRGQKQAIALMKVENDQKRERLEAKYADLAIVDAIMAGQVWHDMTKEQLLESWGAPEEVETKTLKTKIKHTYKYDRVGVGRFSRRATLENDRVVAWESKS